MNYIVANRIPVARGYEAMFEERFKNRAGQIDKQPGFVRMQVLKPESDNSPFIVLTTWEDEQAFANWVKSEDFKIAHQNPMPKDAFEGDSRLEQHKVIVHAERK